MSDVIAYKWMKREGEKFSKREGGLVPAKVSDHDRALSCSICGKSIVHVVYIKDGDNVGAYGLDCAHVKLGLKNPLTRATAIALAERYMNRKLFDHRGDMAKVKEEIRRQVAYA
jgi:hypothetical protein